MEFGYVGIVVAVVLFFVGLKVAKLLMWALAIIVVVVAGIIFYF